MRVIYLCGNSTGPVGGHKVIYRHAKTLKTIGLDCKVFHPSNPSFRASWFEDQPDFIEALKINPATDFLVIPEKYALSLAAHLAATGTRFALFVQNGFLCHKTLEQKDLLTLRQVYEKASFIVTVSQTIHRWIEFWFPVVSKNNLVQINPAVMDELRTASGTKENLITFMPRKSAEDARMVVAMARTYCPPNWQFAAIDQLHEREAANLLLRSSIFLSFSQREGLGLPPIEAAIAGNFVVGYTGSAGRDYFKAPLFSEVPREEFLDFVNQIFVAIKRVESGGLDSEAVKSQQAQLSKEFSRANEYSQLLRLSKKISQLFQ